MYLNGKQSLKFCWILLWPTFFGFEGPMVEKTHKHPSQWHVILVVTWVTLERGANDRINSLTEIHLYKLLILTCRIFCKKKKHHQLGIKKKSRLKNGWLGIPGTFCFLEDPPSHLEVFNSNFAPENGSGFEDALAFLNLGFPFVTFKDRSNYISNFEGYICIYRIAVYC